ncbi:hypothetical protein [Actinospongicola halichondriae]|uniref:hypothetical protein n=1 Tax=Actinospongicola halichondriae TaxID=3236844 RepID=UPI003D38D875
MNVGPRRRVLLLVFVVTAGWALLGAGAHATRDDRLTADEPQYVLSAISLIEDGDLDIADELADERWRAFHAASLPRQTEPRPDGSELSPHDPLLPLLLAPGVGSFGWVGARLTMALVVGALGSVLVWTAVARLGVRPRTAVLVTSAFCMSPPITSYGSQIYPESVAALAVAVAAASLLGPRSRARTAVWLLAVVALPWLGVKYAGVALVLGIVGLWRDRHLAPAVLGAAGVAGASYLAFHQAVYGGWTVYAAGDHFVGGEFTVVGDDPDHLARTVRLLGLLVDRDFGLVAWAPAFLLAVPAVAWTARRADAARVVLLAPLAAGYATATWVALTMHGWWWPGRQTVVVLPLAVLAVARFVDGRRRLVNAVVAAGALGALSWLWLTVETTHGSLTLIVDFFDTTNPWMRVWRSVLPDERADGTATVIGNVVWAAILAAGGLWGWRSAGADEDAFAGEGPDADGVAVDLDGGRAVGR